MLIYRQNRKMQTNSFVTCFPVFFHDAPEIADGKNSKHRHYCYFTWHSLEGAQSCGINSKTQRNNKQQQKFVAAKHLPTGKIINKELKRTKRQESQK